MCVRCRVARCLAENPHVSAFFFFRNIRVRLCWTISREEKLTCGWGNKPGADNLCCFFAVWLTGLPPVWMRRGKNVSRILRWAVGTAGKAIHLRKAQGIVGHCATEKYKPLQRVSAEWDTCAVLHKTTTAGRGHPVSRRRFFQLGPPGVEPATPSPPERSTNEHDVLLRNKTNCFKSLFLVLPWMTQLLRLLVKLTV